MKETAKTKRADTIFQETVRIMWRNRCVWCKCWTEAGAGHHLYGRSRQDTRWDLMLAPYLCTQCHNTVHNQGQAALLSYLRKEWPPIYGYYITKKRETRIDPWVFDEFVDDQIAILKEKQEELCKE